MDKSITCDICSEEYDLDEKRPISLGCGHSLCKQCIQKHLIIIAKAKLENNVIKQQQYKACPSCQREMLNFEDINQYFPNYALEQQIEKKPLLIGCCPADLVPEKLQSGFFDQLQLGNLGFGLKIQHGSFLSEQVIEVQFDNYRKRKAAMDILPYKVFRLNADDMNIWIFVPKNNSNFNQYFKNYTYHYDFVMIQHSTSILRNPETDLIRIESAPSFYNRKNIVSFQTQLQGMIGQDLQDLTVRHYKPGRDSSFFVIYLGSYGKAEEVKEVLFSNKFKFTSPNSYQGPKNYDLSIEPKGPHNNLLRFFGYPKLNR